MHTYAHTMGQWSIAIPATGILFGRREEIREPGENPLTDMGRTWGVTWAHVTTGQPGNVKCHYCPATYITSQRKTKKQSPSLFNEHQRFYLSEYKLLLPCRLGIKSLVSISGYWLEDPFRFKGLKGSIPKQRRDLQTTGIVEEKESEREQALQYGWGSENSFESSFSLIWCSVDFL